MVGCVSCRRTCVTSPPLVIGLTVIHCACTDNVQIKLYVRHTLVTLATPSWQVAMVVPVVVVVVTSKLRDVRLQG